MMRTTRLGIALAIVIGGQAATAQSRIDCNALNSRILKQVVRYCVYVPAGYDAGAAQRPPKRYPILYLLHGLGDNEQTLFNNGGWTLLVDLRNQRKIGEFLIVAPEGRASFYVNSADGAYRYSDFFLQEFLPQIERKYRVVPGRAGRAITGVSMGGYGALRFAFAHPELFSAVSAQSAALITQTPEQLNVVSQAGASLLVVLFPVFGKPINAEHWNQNSVFVLAKRNATAILKLRISFNCGQDDNYGFEKGAARLHDELQKQGIKHEYHAYPGDHSLGYFLAHFDELLEFHSRAFGLLAGASAKPPGAR